MKKIKVFAMLSLLIVSVFSLTACGEKGNSGKDLETLKSNLEVSYNNLESLNYEKFTLYYETDSDVEWSKTTLEYDADGYFHCYQYMKEKADSSGELEEYVWETHMWVDENTLTQASSKKVVGYNNNMPDNRYYVTTYSSYEEALEKFEWYLKDENGNDFNFLRRNPIEYAIDKNYEFIEAMKEDLEYYFQSEDERVSYNISKNEEKDYEFSRNFNDWVYSIHVVNGYVTSYEEDEPQTWKRNFTMALEWSFETPDLSKYYDYSVN